MSRMRIILSVSGVALLIAVATLAAGPFGRRKIPDFPRTPDGQPDLQGIWTNATLTPLERPPELAGKEFFTEQEVAAYEKQMLREDEQGSPRWRRRSRRRPRLQRRLVGYRNQNRIDPANFDRDRSAGWKDSAFDSAGAGANGCAPGGHAAPSPPAPRTGACPSAASCGRPRARPCCRARTTTIIRSCRLPDRWRFWSR